MNIATNIKATEQFRNILASVIGQMSDGIWENTRSMEKYWKSLDYSVNPAGFLVIEDRHGVCSNPCDFFANKIKQIIKIEIEDGADLYWDRNCGKCPTYIHGPLTTVGDCYALYELLKGRSTTGKSYATYSPYKVSVELLGTKYDIAVKALSLSSARNVAIQKLTASMKILDVTTV